MLQSSNSRKNTNLQARSKDITSKQEKQSERHSNRACIGKISVANDHTKKYEIMYSTLTWGEFRLTENSDVS